ncbi:MAG: hypothetical protein KKC05_00355 [Nanoarchaeota archaeon]|nr:hypothetical protein [Nanoarchaeota archaeon]
MKSKTILVSFLFAIFLLTPLVYAYGLTMDTTLKIDDASRGQTYEKMIRIHATGIDMNVEFTTEGDIADWVKVYRMDEPETEITTLLIQGETNLERFVNVLAKISVPEDTPVGIYEGKIVAQQVSEVAEGETAQSFGLRASTQVKVIVTGTQNLDGKVMSITADDVELARPLKIVVNFRNEGNVLANPDIDVEITKNGKSIDSFEYSDAIVKVGTVEEIVVDWETAGQTIGDYRAHVQVMLDSEELGDETIDFKILERGALSADGEIVSVNSPDEVVVGKTAKIEVEFKNTGDIDMDAKIKAEVYSGEDLVKVIEGDSVFVNSGRAEKIVAYFTPDAEGTYSIEGHVAYEGKKTTFETISLAVVSETVSLGDDTTPETPADGTGEITGNFLDDIPMSFLVPVGIVIVVVFFLGLFMWAKR